MYNADPTYQNDESIPLKFQCLAMLDSLNGLLRIFAAVAARLLIIVTITGQQPAIVAAYLSVVQEGKIRSAS